MVPQQHLYILAKGLHSCSAALPCREAWRYHVSSPKAELGQEPKHTPRLSSRDFSIIPHCLQRHLYQEASLYLSLRVLLYSSLVTYYIIPK